MDKKAQALALQEAQESLHEQIGDVVREAERGDRPLEMTLFFQEAGEDRFAEEDAALAQRIRTTVEAFLHRGVVQESSVEIARVTVIDSDADGEPAVNVQFEYAV